MGQTFVKEEDSGRGNDWGNDQKQQKQEDGEEGDELDSFRPLLSHLRLEKLPELAISLKTALLRADISSPLTCTVSPQPLTGAYNILYRVSFSDGTAWVFKVPCIGYLPEWSEASERNLRSEANTMNFIRKHTRIPVPEVYAFDSRLDNVINAPYIERGISDSAGLALSEIP